MKKTFPILVAVGLSLIVGFLSSLVQSPSLELWYPTLIKSALTPPGWVFPIVWNLIYVCSGLSMGLVWRRPSYMRQPLAWVWSWQLVLNFLWSVMFFAMQSPILAFANILALDIAVVMYAVHAWRVNRLAGWLFVPYVVWLAFATYLNGFVVAFN